MPDEIYNHIPDKFSIQRTSNNNNDGRFQPLQAARGLRLREAELTSGRAAVELEVRDPEARRGSERVLVQQRAQRVRQRRRVLEAAVLVGARKTPTERGLKVEEYIHALPVTF